MKIGHTSMNQSNWHEKHKDSLGFSEKLADIVAAEIGSWHFIVWQTVIVSLWALLNITAFINHWDPYPFILLNLLFSTQAAYAAPIIMMAQNRQAERDRIQAQHDYETNIAAKEEIEELKQMIIKLEKEKIDVLLERVR